MEMFDKDYKALVDSLLASKDLGAVGATWLDVARYCRYKRLRIGSLTETYGNIGDWVYPLFNQINHMIRLLPNKLTAIYCQTLRTSNL